MFSTLISPLPLPRSRTPNPYLNPFVPGNGTTATSEFESPLQPSTHVLQGFDLSAHNNEKRKYNRRFTVSEDEDPLAEAAIEAEAEEEFFRNMYTYLDECDKNKTSFQLLLFVDSMQHGGTLAMLAIQRGLSRIIGLFGGAVTSEWLLRASKKGDSHLDGGVELDELEEPEEEGMDEK